MAAQNSLRLRKTLQTVIKNQTILKHGRRCPGLPLTWSIVRSLHTGQCLSPQIKKDLADASEENRLSENDNIGHNFINRNPRNLERMALALKDAGWTQSFPRRQYYHKLVIDHSSRNIDIWIEHYNGHQVVSASTKEWAIRKHLYSSVDVAAMKNLGHVLARRCLESGIVNIVHQITEEERNSEKNQVLLKALEDGGIIFEEPDPERNFKEDIDYFPENI